MLTLLLIACGTTAPAPAPREAPAPAGLPAEGKVFHPAVEASEVPSGAWYCDMGTVHYAASEKGDGVCPVCKMKLVQKP